MPAEPQNKLVTIRMSKAMIAAWEAAAAAAGMQKSLWLRRLIEREVAASGAGALNVKAELGIGAGGMTKEQLAARSAKYRKTIAQRKQAKQAEKKS